MVGTSSEDTEMLSQCSSVTETNLHEGDGHFLHAQVSGEQGTLSQPSVPACAWLSLSRVTHYRLFVTSCLDTTLTFLGNLPDQLTDEVFPTTLEYFPQVTPCPLHATQEWLTALATETARVLQSWPSLTGTACGFPSSLAPVTGLAYSVAGLLCPSALFQLTSHVTSHLSHLPNRAWA